MKTYQFIDSGDQKKLERFGEYLLIRPSASALWKPSLTKEWKEADAAFTREKESRWSFRRSLPSSWVVEASSFLFKIEPTDFGHVGLFPEHLALCSWMEEVIQSAPAHFQLLNLFAYSGAATLAAVRAGAQVCHLDASKAAVRWARENAALNGCKGAPVRWIVDDVFKFLKREEKRGSRYDGILLDPPSFGRGSKGEVFKIERDLYVLLKMCRSLFSRSFRFLILSSHTPGLTPLALRQLLEEIMEGQKGEIEAGELFLSGEGSRLLPSGAFARWKR
ncbi:MAG TPA: hypothetical protein DCY54_01735 [Parachlamydiales bacterium]|nr:MAG: hypothetical protein A2Z85_00725 [Chlamydiae bacterium GWA2_50_15]OGN55163.1 MAG: hypothetical protein A2098_03045 [Chlamydiae bacterium GWF2_49_8]OGN64615.1 MAG: hypothetical protein A3E26_04290 [Chlamydiae bacterium RIFCSPHIGHO2_12_FULL_49_32]OGN68025.1 MAG: hypothetical protein A3I15_00045 [Chlamydiae bacterium RIFCSPLOWO2_02_FULL_49_12]OGN70585.1 MAG: hypothetical protein A3G30_04690 [Chlamydiae bacterium RIFCSPLOWO2_12_FULL_49_12]HAZ15355.1 hypothetical protein [Parachlamydiales b